MLEDFKEWAEKYLQSHRGLNNDINAIHRVLDLIESEEKLDVIRKGIS